MKTLNKRVLAASIATMLSASAFAGQIADGTTGYAAHVVNGKEVVIAQTFSHGEMPADVKVVPSTDMPAQYQTLNQDAVAKVVFDADKLTSLNVGEVATLNFFGDVEATHVINKVHHDNGDTSLVTETADGGRAILTFGANGVVAGSVVRNESTYSVSTDAKGGVWMLDETHSGAAFAGYNGDTPEHNHVAMNAKTLEKIPTSDAAMAMNADMTLGAPLTAVEQAEQDVATAQAAVDSAKAALVQAQTNATAATQAVTNATAEQTSAQSNVAQTAAQVSSATQAVQVAQAALTTAQAKAVQTAAQVKAAKLALAKVQAAANAAQAKANVLVRQANVAQAKAVQLATVAANEKAKIDLQTTVAKRNAQTKVANTAAAKAATQARIAQNSATVAANQVKAAQAAANAVAALQVPTAAQVNVQAAQQALANAQAAVAAAVQANQTSQAALQAAIANVAQAQANAQAATSTVAQAQAAVDTATTALATATANLQKAKDDAAAEAARPKADPANSVVVKLNGVDTVVPAVDVLVYAADTILNAETTINNYFAVTNQAYLDSGVKMQVRVAKLITITDAYPTSTSAALAAMRGAIGQFSNIQADMVSFKADLVQFFHPLKAAQGMCGQGYLNGMAGTVYNKVSVFSVASTGQDGSYYCNSFTSAHELGHNMGMVHNKENSGGVSGHFADGFGYGLKNFYGDIMSYFPQKGVFSTPNLYYLNDSRFPFGVEGVANVSNGLTAAAAEIAAFDTLQ